jgi:phosphate uptake regulator
VDQIRFSYSDSKLSSKIQKAIREETLGYEIIKQRSDFCIVKCITNQVQSEFSPLLRRTFLLLISMAEDSLTAVKDKDYESLKNIRFMELTNNRYVTICRRIINKIGLPDYQNPNFIYYIIEELERLADHYKYICDYFLGLENEINLSKKTHDFYKETNSMVRDLYNLFYNFKPETAVAVAKKRKKLVKASFELFEHAPRNELVVVHNLSIIFQKIFCSLGIIIAMNV